MIAAFHQTSPAAAVLMAAALLVCFPGCTPATRPSVSADSASGGNSLSGTTVAAPTSTAGARGEAVTQQQPLVESEPLVADVVAPDAPAAGSEMMGEPAGSGSLVAEAVSVRDILGANPLRSQPSPRASSSAGPGAASGGDAAAAQPATLVAAASSSGGDTGAASGKRYEPLFVDWPAPQLALLITGRQHGYIEPCGCSGLTNQKGGLVRRFTLLRELRDRGWTVVPLDLGDQVRRFGRQPEIKFQMTVEGLKQMGYRAIGFGPDDLRLSVGELVALTASDGQTPSPFVSANAAVIDASLTPRYQVIEAAGKRIGVTAVLGADELAKITSDEIVKSTPEESLRRVWVELEAQRCDLYVLLAHTSIDDSIRLAQTVPGFDVVVTAGGEGEPTYEFEKVPNTQAVMVQVGTKGMHAGVIGVFDDADRPLRYQRVPLDARFPDSREMLQLLASYQQQLESAGLEGLGVRPVAHASGRTFVGSDSCKDCHTDEYKIWEDTPHAHALDSLIHPGERSEVPRHFDPECISCHVVGWNPQKYFPYASGYLGVKETPQMHHVGCENCHGPGSRHSAAETSGSGASEAELAQYREEVRLPLEAAEKHCMECHDLDNSPDFHVEGAFEDYWQQVEH